jgi:hypothetical protein
MQILISETFGFKREDMKKERKKVEEYKYMGRIKSVTQNCMGKKI